MYSILYCVSLRHGSLLYIYIHSIYIHTVYIYILYCVYMYIGCLSRLVHSEGLTIPQLGQVWVNISHLADAIPDLEKFIRTLTK